MCTGGLPDGLPVVTSEPGPGRSPWSEAPASPDDRRLAGRGTVAATPRHPVDPEHVGDHGASLGSQAGGQAGSASSLRMASASPSGSPAGTSMRRPGSGFGNAAHRRGTTARPCARLSSTAFGMPSDSEGSTVNEQSSIRAGTSATEPRNWTSSSIPYSRAWARSEASSGPSPRAAGAPPASATPPESARRPRVRWLPLVGNQVSEDDDPLRRLAAA